tara:strand:+ start:1100 stop:1501 length:402 start_codon:yes stop_codon:yes gene_type:complete
MADNPLSRGQIRPTRDPLDDVPNDVGGRDDNILPPTKKPPEMLELLPMSQEEIFKQDLMKVQEQEERRKPLKDWFRDKFNSLQDSVPGEVRSLLMHQLREGFNTFHDLPDQPDFSEENAEVIRRILADRELNI